MNLGKILEDCAALESLTLSLIANNSLKCSQLSEYQDNLIEKSNQKLEQIVDYECKLQEEYEDQLTQLKDLENEIKHFSSINEKLNELLAIINGNRGGDTINHSTYSNILNTIQDYEQIRSESCSMISGLTEIMESYKSEMEEAQSFVQREKSLAVGVRKNMESIKILDKQNKFAESQFDLILNQLPWEPISESKILELRESSDPRIRDIVDCIDIQTAEINDLHESIRFKKERKLEVLTRLAYELNNFIRKRDFD